MQPSSVLPATPTFATTVRLALATFWTLAIGAPLIASPPSEAPLAPQLVKRIDEVLADLDSTDSPGCALGIFRRGEIVYRHGYGMASLENGVPIDSRTVFYSGSVSKQFVAAAMARAALTGRLSLDDSVRRWLPELPAYAEQITVRHLVHHTSGLRDYLGLMELAGIDYENVFDRRSVLDLIVRQAELNFPPGSQHLYSNSGYFLMSLIIERATGLTLRHYAEQELFRPLGMHDTHFHDDRFEVVSRRAAAYAPAPQDQTQSRPERGRFIVAWSPTFEQVGSGGLLTTIEDLARWDRSYYDGSLGAGFWDSLLEVGVLNSGEELAYAFGLTIDTYRGVRRIQHGGAMFGYRAQLSRFPELGATIALLCNLANADPGGLAEQVSDLTLAGSLSVRKPPTQTPRDEQSVATPSTALPAEWAGVFHSDELDVDYEILEHQGAAAIRIKNKAPQPIRFSADGSFEFAGAEGPGGATGRPRRDNRGRLTGFELEAGRVRHLRFAKTSRDR